MNKIIAVAKKNNNKFFLNFLNQKNKIDIKNIKYSNGNSIKDNDIVCLNYNKLNNIDEITKISNLSRKSGLLKLAINENGLEENFSEDIVKDCNKLNAKSLTERKDITNIPLITIDGENAKDFDDGVYAEKLKSGNYKVIVAIADVVHFIDQSEKLDKEAENRGNSIYLANRVIPMLPEILSNELCSLKENEKRLCVALEFTIDENANVLNHKFYRAIMKSYKRVTYTEAQNLFDKTYKKKDSKSKISCLVNSLFSVYEILANARQKRQSLNIDSCEYEYVFKNKNLINIVRKKNLKSQKVIEELMIISNVIAAKSLLLAKTKNIMFRCHDEPPQEKIEILKNSLNGLGVKNNKIKKDNLNSLIQKNKKNKNFDVIKESVLRSQSKAYYSPNNIGHFGLDLEKYCHFTSPIRRYSDVLIHKEIINNLMKSNEKSLKKDNFNDLGEKLSLLERKAIDMERKYKARLSSMYVKNKIEKSFNVFISSFTEKAMFVFEKRLGLDGIIFFKKINDDFYFFDRKNMHVKGKRKKTIFKLGQKLSVKLIKVDEIKGKLEFIINLKKYR